MQTVRTTRSALEAISVKATEWIKQVAIQVERAALPKKCFQEVPRASLELVLLRPFRFVGSSSQDT